MPGALKSVERRRGAGEKVGSECSVLARPFAEADVAAACACHCQWRWQGAEGADAPVASAVGGRAFYNSRSGQMQDNVMKPQIPDPPPVIATIFPVMGKSPTVLVAMSMSRG